MQGNHATRRNVAFEIAQILERLLEQMKTIDQGKIERLAAEKPAQVMRRKELAAADSKDPAAGGPAALRIGMGIDADGERIGLDGG